MGCEIYPYHKTSSKKLPQTLWRLDLFDSYKIKFQIQNQIANALCDIIGEINDQFLPTFISKEKRVFLAIGNTDFINELLVNSFSFENFLAVTCYFTNPF